MDKINKLIMVSLDDLRADCLFNPSVFNKKFEIQNELNIPNLKWLMKHSIELTNCFTTSPYTSASHASYFTGCWPKHHGVLSFFKQQIKVPTIYQILKENNYHTFFCTDFPFILGKHLGFTKGIDKYYTNDEQQAIEDFNKTEGDKFAFIHFADIHWPYGFHKLFIKKEAEELRKFIEEKAKNNVILDKQLKKGFIEAIRGDQERLLEQNYRKLINYHYVRKEFNTLMNWYADGISRFDNGRFGQFLKSLKKLGILEDPTCLIIFFSDHGEAWSDESYGHFDSNDIGVINVPVFIYNKNLTPQTISKLTRTIDVIPSISNLLSVKKPFRVNFDGHNFFQRDSNYALIQSWVSEEKELIKFLNDTFKSGKFIEGLVNSYLFKQSIIRNNHKLEIKHDKKGKIISEKHFVIKNNTEKRITNISFKKELLLLEEYNSDIKKVGEKHRKIKVKNTIFNDLKNLGYFGEHQ